MNPTVTRGSTQPGMQEPGVRAVLKRRSKAMQHLRLLGKELLKSTAASKNNPPKKSEYSKMVRRRRNTLSNAPAN